MKSIGSPRYWALLKTTFKRGAVFWLCGLLVLVPDMLGYPLPKPFVVVVMCLGVAAWVWTASAGLKMFRQMAEDSAKARNPKEWKP